MPSGRHLFLEVTLQLWALSPSMKKLRLDTLNYSNAAAYQSQVFSVDRKETQRSRSDAAEP